MILVVFAALRLITALFVRSTLQVLAKDAGQAVLERLQQTAELQETGGRKRKNETREGHPKREGETREKQHGRSGCVSNAFVVFLVFFPLWFGLVWFALDWFGFFGFQFGESSARAIDHSALCASKC